MAETNKERPRKNNELTAKEKEIADKVVKMAFKQYGEVIRKLGKT